MKRQQKILVMNASSQISCSDHDGATSRNGIPSLLHTLYMMQISSQSHEKQPVACWYFLLYILYKYDIGPIYFYTFWASILRYIFLTKQYY